MLLTVDVGNTFTNIVLFDKDQIVNSWSIKSNKPIDKNLFGNIDAISLSCVVKNKISFWENISKELNCEFYNLSLDTVPSDLLISDFTIPDDIGADIIAAIIAAKNFYKLPCVICDLGTATNLTILDESGKFLGVVIAPGIETSFKALFQNASGINSFEIKAPKEVFSYKTEEAVRSGIVIGEAAKIDGLVKRINSSANVITTGGWSKLVSKYMECNPEHEEFLIQKALKLAYEQYR